MGVQLAAPTGLLLPTSNSCDLTLSSTGSPGGLGRIWDRLSYVALEQGPLPLPPYLSVGLTAPRERSTNPIFPTPNDPTLLSLSPQKVSVESGSDWVMWL